jgi:hypothetical protein
MLQNTRMTRMADTVLLKGKIKPMDFEWQKQKELNSFALVHHVVLGALSLMIVVRKRIIHMIKDINAEKIPLGMMNFANKGAINISFQLLDRRLLFINNHLAAHMENRQTRFDQFMQIYKSWCVPPEKLSQLERRTNWLCCGPTGVDEKAHE